MTISSEFLLAGVLHSSATRESGAAARAMVLEALKLNSTVKLNFSGVNMTPSFADEFVGKLAEALGSANFRERIRMESVSSALRPLLKQVISRRLDSSNRLRDRAIA